MENETAFLRHNILTGQPVPSGFFWLRRSLAHEHVIFVTTVTRVAMRVSLVSWREIGAATMVFFFLRFVSTLRIGIGSRPYRTRWR